MGEVKIIFMNIFLHGSDTFRSRQQLKKMVEKFKVDRDPQGLNVAILDCAVEELGKVLEQVLASPFLAEKRMVVLENLLTATGKKDLQTEIFERVKAGKISEDTILLFWEGGGKPKTDVAKKFYKLLAQEKFAQEFGELKGIQLGGWIKQEIMNDETITEKLINNANRYGNKSVQRRLGYLLETLKIESSQLMRLQRKLGKSKSLIPFNPTKKITGKIDKKWGIVINE